MLDGVVVVILNSAVFKLLVSKACCVVVWELTILIGKLLEYRILTLFKSPETANSLMSCYVDRTKSFIFIDGAPLLTSGLPKTNKLDIGSTSKISFVPMASETLTSLQTKACDFC